jgi:hypothetical protein
MWRYQAIMASALLTLIIGVALADGVSVPLAIPQSSPGAAMAYPPVSTGFTGLGDVATAVWYGAIDQCYSSTYVGNVADITNAAGTVGTRRQCNNGVISDLMSGSACTFVTGNACSALSSTCSGTCSIKTVYDQTTGNLCSGGPCNPTQATIANMGVMTANAVGTHYCGLFTASSSQGMQSANISSSIPQIFSTLIITERTGAFTSFGGPFSARPALARFTSVASTFQHNDGTSADVTASDSAPHVFQAIWNSPGFSNTSTVYVGSTANLNLDVGPNTITGNAVTIGSDGLGNFLTGYYCEAAIFASDQTSNISSLYSNAQARYPTGGL